MAMESAKETGKPAEVPRGARLVADLDRGLFLSITGPAPETFFDVAQEALLPQLQGLVGDTLPDWIDFQVKVADALEGAHLALLEGLSGREETHDLSLSATVLLISGSDFQLAHLGRGRPLLYSRRFLHPLTREHTEAFGLYEKGQLKVGEIPDHPGSSVLTRGLGIPQSDPMMATAAAYKKGILRPSDRLILPGGELLAHLGEEAMLEALEKKAPPQDTVEQLVTSARDEGADRASCLLVRYDEPGTLHAGAIGRATPMSEAAFFGEEHLSEPPSTPPSPVVAESPEEPPAKPTPPDTQEPEGAGDIDSLLEDTPSMPTFPPQLAQFIAEESAAEEAASPPARHDEVVGHNLLDDIPAMPAFPPQLAQLMAEESAAKAAQAAEKAAEKPPVAEPPSPLPERQGEVVGHNLLDDIPAMPAFPPQLAKLMAEESAAKAKAEAEAASVAKENAALARAVTLDARPESPDHEPISTPSNPASPPAVRRLRPALVEYRGPPPAQERRLDTEQSSWFDDGFVLGLTLLGALLVVLRLLWLSLMQA